MERRTPGVGRRATLALRCLLLIVVLGVSATLAAPVPADAADVAQLDASDLERTPADGVGPRNLPPGVPDRVEAQSGGPGVSADAGPSPTPADGDAGPQEPAATPSQPTVTPLEPPAEESAEEPTVLQLPDAVGQDVLCVPDPVGDAFVEESDGDRIVDEPRADLVRFCGDLADTLTLQAEVAQPVDPATDEGWAAGAAMYWFLSTTGEGYDHVAIMERGADGGVTAWLVQLTDASEEVRCQGAAELRGDTYVAGAFDLADCLGELPDRIDVAVISLYVVDDEVVMDVSDSFAAIGRTGAPPARDMTRLAGDDRGDTAVAISQEAFPSGARTAYLARADRFPDALAAGTLTDGPLLLVPSCGSLPGPIRDELRRLDPGRVIGLGGASAVCDSMLGQAAAAVGATTERLAGSGAASDRFGTAAAIARRAFPSGAQDVYLATGEDFPDALAAGALTDGPILLVPSCAEVPQVILDAIEESGADRVIALGGPNAVCDQVLDDAVAAAADGATDDRLSGGSRFATAAAIARFQFFDGAESVYLARADEFPDALAAGGLTDGPVLLVPSCGDLPPVVANALRALDPQRVVGLGGPDAVCDQMVRHAANS